MEDIKVSVIIPTLNAENELPDLLNRLHEQSQLIEEIIVVDSESEDKTFEICKVDSSIRFLTIKRTDFDHGGTRDWALKQAIGNVIIFLTQDAVPADDFLVERLIAPLKNENVAVSTGRQLPKDNATHMERLVRSFNYPPESTIHTKSDLSVLGIKTFFCSDSCAAYNKDIYLKLGGFERPVKTNEDMFFAAKAINCGYSVSYTAEARVFHSHNLTLKQQYKRNYIQGYEIERHKDLLCNVSQTSEGIRLVKRVSKKLLKKGRIVSFFRFGLDCTARLLGSKAGKMQAQREQDLKLQCISE